MLFRTLFHVIDANEVFKGFLDPSSRIARIKYSVFPLVWREERACVFSFLLFKKIIVIYSRRNTVVECHQSSESNIEITKNERYKYIRRRGNQSEVYGWYRYCTEGKVIQMNHEERKPTKENNKSICECYVIHDVQHFFGVPRTVRFDPTPIVSVFAWALAGWLRRRLRASLVISLNASTMFLLSFAEVSKNGRPFCSA